MASASVCAFCGEPVHSSERTCPRCGGNNAGFVPESAPAFLLPKSIEELKEFCADRQIPLDRLRFHVGEDDRLPRAYGIFKAGEDRFVVYKNKADGSRSVRYDGPDEAFAVSELFAKLLEICQRQGVLSIRN